MSRQLLPGTFEHALNHLIDHELDHSHFDAHYRNDVTGAKAYGRRFATVEPVFGNIRGSKRLNRFTLRGRSKVDTQWKLYCLVHNIEKLMNYGNLAGKR